MRVQVPRFTPALGLRFANAFPHVPVREFDFPPLGTFGLGDAANGLCGGMSFTVADLFAAGSPPPEDPDPPAGGSARFDYLVDRQIDTLAAGRLPLRFFSLMSPTRSERESIFARAVGALGIDRHSRTWVMVHEEWPAIKATIDGGALAMIGLVKVVSADPRQLNRNHQVIAYGYDLEGTALKLLILDPNLPRREIELGLDIADPTGTTTVTYVTSDGTFKDNSLVCFFAYPYAKREPEPWVEAHTRRDE